MFRHITVLLLITHAISTSGETLQQLEDLDHESAFKSNENIIPNYIRDKRADQNIPKDRVKRRITQNVEDYATQMETAHGINRPIGPIETSISQYTYKTTTNANGETVKLPLVVRARITKVKPANSRKNEVDISSDAKKNCKLMGMNKGRTDYNDDEMGHLVAFKHYGSAEFYNVVPQTTRINIGTRTNSLDAPSLWAIGERSITHFVEKDKGVIDLTVVVKYEGTNTRPAFFGVVGKPLDSAFNPHPTEKGLVSIWYTNDPEDDPDSPNH